MNFAIIAAGEGSRLVSEGISSPKPLVCLDGRPMIGRLIDIFKDCGAEDISVIVNEQMTEVADYVRSRMSDAPVRLTVKSTPSSMHSFYEVSRDFKPGKFVLTTVDTIFREDDFKRYIAAFKALKGPEEGLMAITPFIEDEKPLYVNVEGPEHRITAFSDTPSSPFVSGGIYGLTAPAALKVLERCFEEGVSRMRNYQRALVASGMPLHAFVIDKILDVDHADDIERARAFLRQEG